MEWSIRITHEMAYYDACSFVTLTYDNEHLPPDGSLNKRDLQLYLKRLRKSVAPARIKYFACGEYGERFRRPHYHLILLGLGVKDTALITNSWPGGYVHVAECNEKTISYVVGYMSKDAGATPQGLSKPMQMQSQGLGYRFAAANKAMLAKKGYITWHGKKAAMPRYYARKLSLSREAARAAAIEESEQMYKKLIERHVDRLTPLDIADLTAVKQVSPNLALSRLCSLLGVYVQADADIKAKTALKPRDTF